MADVTERLHLVIAEVDVLSAEPRTIELLHGGLTNVSYKVTTPRCTAAVRLSVGDGQSLLVDRAHEHTNSVRAERSGAAPAVLAYHPGARALVVEWVEGRTLTAVDLRDDTTLVRAAAVARTLHAGPRFAGRLDPFAMLQSYLQIVLGRGYRLPAGFLEHLPALARVADTLTSSAEPTVPCHNDLVPGNIIDDGQRLWLVDFDYGANNEACFELGNLWSGADLGPDRLDLLVDSYYGRHYRHKVARARLMAMVAQYAWTLWGSIQAAESRIDFDFWSWATGRYHTVAGQLSGRDFDRLLDEAGLPD